MTRPTVHGFCKIDIDGSVRLVFNTGNPKMAVQAPVVQHLLDAPLYELVEGFPPVGFSVAICGDNHGLLHYSEESALVQAKAFSAMFQRDYICVSLIVGEQIDV